MSKTIEEILKELQSAGNAGEFYTPRAVTQFIVEQVNSRLGETLLDPACGTGGMEEDGIESNFRSEFRTRETADLFLVLLMKILKPGGRAGLVLPEYEKLLAQIAETRGKLKTQLMEALNR